MDVYEEPTQEEIDQATLEANREVIATHKELSRLLKKEHPDLSEDEHNKFLRTWMIFSAIDSLVSMVALISEER